MGVYFCRRNLFSKLLPSNDNEDTHTDSKVIS
jgi:hypothetical protein